MDIEFSIDIDALLTIAGVTLATFGYETVVNLLGKAGIGKRA